MSSHHHGYAILPPLHMKSHHHGYAILPPSHMKSHRRRYAIISSSLCHHAAIAYSWQTKAIILSQGEGIRGIFAVCS
ncbi:MAG: hypothetical protein IIU87_03395 [Prevotella sp.]|nr:hypothetical protein [Prevotella sp.]